MKNFMLNTKHDMDKRSSNKELHKQIEFKDKKIESLMQFIEKELEKYKNALKEARNAGIKEGVEIGKKEVQP